MITICEHTYNKVDVAFTVAPAATTLLIPPCDLIFPEGLSRNRVRPFSSTLYEPCGETTAKGVPVEPCETSELAKVLWKGLHCCPVERGDTRAAETSTESSREMKKL